MQRKILFLVALFTTLIQPYLFSMNGDDREHQALLSRMSFTYPQQAEQSQVQETIVDVHAVEKKQLELEIQHLKYHVVVLKDNAQKRDQEAGCELFGAGLYICSAGGFCGFLMAFILTGCVS